VNLCFDACFPEHEEAERLAARLARFGINCVRMHHMDAGAIWGDSPNKLTIDPKKLERLDYLIWQLKLHGIYTNLNLHVSRWLGEAEGFPNPRLRPDYDKGVGNFEPRMIALQKQYASDLLTHRNPYTKTAYCAEPAVAFVEISNEDSLLAVWHWGQLETLPDPYAATLRKLWNAWLRKKHGDTTALRKAWGDGGTTTLGQEMLDNGDFTRPLDQAWRVERDDRTKAEFAIVPGGGSLSQRPALRIAVAQGGEVSWHPQLVHAGFALKKQKAYTLAFRLRSDKPERCRVSCQMAHPPWDLLGLDAEVNARPDDQEHRLTFLADRDDPSARIVFRNFAEGATYSLADVSLRPGGIVGIEPAERLEDDTVPVPRRLGQRAAASDDFCDFVADTEGDYWHGMYRFLKEDLHVRSLVSGTQLGYSLVSLQAGLDYLDNHAYWQHPNFPRRPWDRQDWFIEDVALVNTPGETLTHLASARVAGKPYTVSEYNHPAPNSHAAEGFPMFSAFAGFQNWDGIYAFTYSHNRQFEPRRLENFFDMKSNTVQLAHLPACVAMFVRRDVAPAARTTLFPFSRDVERSRLHETRNGWSLTAAELLRDVCYPLRHGTALDLADPAAANKLPFSAEGGEPLAAGRFLSDTGQICWNIEQKEAGYFTVNAPRTKLFTGFVRGRTFSLGDVTLAVGPSRLDWATVSMVVIEGEGFDSDQPARILIAATGWMQNQDAIVERLGDHRITLRDQWGGEPVLCEGIQAKITLPISSPRVTCSPLDASGNRRAAIPLGQRDGRTEVELDPRHETVWYELEIQGTTRTQAVGSNSG
jgi:hypothetical protein